MYDLQKNIKYPCDKKFIQLYVCQKLSKKIYIWKSYGKNKTVQFFLPHSVFPVTDEASAFKIEKMLEFTNAHHEILLKEKVGVAMG